MENGGRGLKESALRGSPSWPSCRWRWLTMGPASAGFCGL